MRKISLYTINEVIFSSRVVANLPLQHALNTQQINVLHSTTSARNDTLAHTCERRA
jgi:hypothetical protein